MTSTVPHIANIGIQMAAHGLEPEWVIRVVALASQSEGVSDMLHLWEEFASDEAERAEVVADLDEALSDNEGPMVGAALQSMSQAERELNDRRALKQHWRERVERAGGVSAVARASGIPQPSLSRILGDLSKPRASTLEKLAKGLGVPVEALQGVAAIELGVTRRLAKRERRPIITRELISLHHAQSEPRKAIASPGAVAAGKRRMLSRGLSPMVTP